MVRFLVTVLYRQPSYEKHTSGNVSRLQTYRGSYEVVANDEERARQLAVEEFKRTARLSGSSWVRLIVRVDCRALENDVDCIEGGQ